MEVTNSIVASDINKILDFLYLGDEDSTQLKYIKKYNIKTVISAAIEYKINPNSPIQSLKTYKDVEYYCIPIADEDSVSIEKYFHIFAKLIRDNIRHSKNTLVHCGKGQSRSPSIIIAYLIIYHYMTYEEAFNFVNKRRPGIRPNDGFILKLKQLELNSKKE